MKRLSSIDIMRGIVMILMALDHVRDLMHTDSITQNPTNLTTTTPLLFFTRWITHLCAPTFVFLSGASAWLSFKNSTNPDVSRRFLLTRGLWLVVLEFTLVNFALWFDIHFSTFIFDVIATIGFGFIILSFLLKASGKTIVIIGLIIICFHNLIQFLPMINGPVIRIVALFFQPGVINISPKTIFVMAYPPIPWLGIMLIGFAAGRFFEIPGTERKKLFLKIGISALAIFVVIRFINVYGDSFPWAVQKNGLYTFLSFINITKYPPSLIFCLVTLGIMFIILFFIEGKKNKFTDIAIVFGRTPLFYFVLHFYIIHILMFAMVFMQGFKRSDLVFGFNFGRPKSGSGIGLWAIYLVWIGIVIVMYPLCKWYGKYKANHTEKKWLRYL
ncbi:MAG TPA: heparan-alpha-glucosaminide N-acetyltransferase domain-containing protein [Puia sp.]|nr:heparan-alpha-glucosaminide N-acetyltransferase domain-containing protein [Puia sp.]